MYKKLILRLRQVCTDNACSWQNHHLEEELRTFRVLSVSIDSNKQAASPNPECKPGPHSAGQSGHCCSDKESFSSRAGWPDLGTGHAEQAAHGAAAPPGGRRQNSSPSGTGRRTRNQLLRQAFLPRSQ